MVCAGIGGVLVALVLPAIRSTRESMRRLQCENNLRQVGSALHSFESVHHHFPCGGDMTLDGSGGAFPRAHAPHTYLLPHLDQAELYSQLDLQARADRSLAASAAGPNRVAQQTSLSVYLCPSDAGNPPFRNNYRACVGVTAFPRFANVLPVPPLPGDGAFFPVNRFIAAQGFTDGISNTAGFSEKLTGSGNSRRFDSARDFFFLGEVADPDTIWNSANFNALHIRACASLRFSDPAHESTTGEFWFYAGLTDTWYSHLLTPNHPIPDCGDVSGMDGCGVITARSLHRGGVNCMMMDGAVRFVSTAIDAAVWGALGTRNGHDPTEY